MDVEQIADLLHGKEEQVWGDSGYLGAASRVRGQNVKWNIARRPNTITRMPEGRTKTRARKEEHSKASIRAKAEHPFRMIKRQFGLTKVRFKGLAKNTAHVVTLFALSNLWMAQEVDSDDGTGPCDGGLKGARRHGSRRQVRRTGGQFRPALCTRSISEASDDAFTT